jgi:hypothetical protein
LDYVERRRTAAILHLLLYVESEGRERKSREREGEEQAAEIASRECST